MQVSVLAPESQPSTRPKSRPVGVAMLVVLAALLVQVLFEGWIVTRFGARSIGPDGLEVVDPAEWPKTIKNTLYFILFGLTALKFTIDRTWRTVTTKADVALLALGVVMVIAGLMGGSTATLIGQALFVYFRGVIVFYAFRALRPNWSQVRPALWIGGGVILVSTLIGIVQFWMGKPAYTAFGWVDMKWVGENRAHGLFDHPNDLGHLGGFMLLGLVAWFVTAEKVAKRWWVLYGVICLGVSVAQSRQSIVAALGAFAVIAVLRRNRWKRLILAGVLFVLIGSVPVALSEENREQLAYRLGGVFNALLLPGRTPGTGPHGPKPQGVDREVRVLFITQGLKLFRVNPVVGYGPGQFGGIVAVKADPQWNLDPRFIEVLGPNGFYMYEFEAVSVDVFWLHLLVEVGALGLLAYLVWMWFVGQPIFAAARRRGPPGDRADPGLAGSTRAGSTRAGSTRADSTRTDSTRTDSTSDRIYVWAAATLVFALLTAAWSPVLEDPIFPPLLFAVLGFGWVLWQRSQGTSPGISQRASQGTPLEPSEQQGAQTHTGGRD